MVPDYNGKKERLRSTEVGTITIKLLVKIMFVHPTSLWRTKKRNPGVSYIKDSYGVRNRFRVVFGTPKGLFTYKL